MKLPISIVIPTFNEEKYLPKLLKSIQKQTMQPKEVIVSDAFSVDKTRVIAKSYGCEIVDGGLPSKARNNGAKIATQPIILFLDADVVLPTRFLEKTFTEMVERKLDITSCLVTPISNLNIDRFLHHFMNNYMRLTQKFYLHITGFCIFVKKDIHQMIGGFDESLILAEEHDYVRRTQGIAKFAFIKSSKIPVSVRRLSEEGRITIALKYTAVALHLIFIGKIRKNIFRYKFGEHFQ